MAKTTTKKKRGSAGRGKTPDATGKHLVIVESPAKARTINRYLGSDYVVLASVGHVRDLPSKNPKGVKAPVPGIDLENNFAPTYEVLSGKGKTITDLKRAAKQAQDVWFATDLDREGEAIAWHLAEELGVSPAKAKRVIFAAITKSDIEKAFGNPHTIDMDRVNAQQARRVLDRIVGYQVSPLLWKKVARGLSAGRVQSVAVRLVVEKEREIRAFIPDEYWEMHANFTLDAGKVGGLVEGWRGKLAERDEKGKEPTQKSLNAWLAEHGAVRAELVEVGGEKFEPMLRADEIIGPATDMSAEGASVRVARAAEAFSTPDAHNLVPGVEKVAKLAGLIDVRSNVAEDPSGRGPARWKRTIEGRVDASASYAVTSITTKRTSSRPAPPFITSTLQQAASSRLSFGAQRTMRAAQQLYEGVEIPGEGPVGLITYMRTDSTNLSSSAIDMVRGYIPAKLGKEYLPEKPNFYRSSNKGAQEAHEAIRPTDVNRRPGDLQKLLTPDQFRLYDLIWRRFVACQMTPALWDSTTALITGGTDPGTPVTFRATGRVLAFDGHLKVMGVPTASDEQTLPAIEEQQGVHPFAIEPRQRFTSPPARYSEASLIKQLESEGIGRPSTYASIVQVIQDRKYVEQVERRFFATDLGEVVTDKLIEAFPRILDVGYTREMEEELDKVEEEHLDWIDMLHRFYGPFKEALELAHESMTHAKAETTPAPEEYRCQTCGSSLVYRFGKNGRFLSCSTYPKCAYACPIDREGRPMPAEAVNVRCPRTGRPMVRKTGRFGPFITTLLEEDEDPKSGMILNLDKKGKVTAPSQPPLETDLECGKCGSMMYLRNGVRGAWLGCSAFPKCRGRGKWAEVGDEKRAALEAQLEEHMRAHPIPIVKTLDGRALTDENGKPLAEAPAVEELVTDVETAKKLAAQGSAGEPVAMGTGGAGEGDERDVA